MITIRPFRALRPVLEKASDIASPPYDVLDSVEAREKAGGNPVSFLHVIKPEIDLPPDIDLHDEKVYQKGAENLRELVDKGLLIQDENPGFYIYRMIMGNHEQTGVIVTASCADYLENRVKKHEHTKPDKESDRVNHILHLKAQCGPVILIHKARHQIDALIEQAMVTGTLLYDFVGDYEIRHIIHHIHDADLIGKIQREFKALDALYIADGHHRSAAAARVMQHYQQNNRQHTGDESYNYFLAVLFPDNQLKILDYNRVVKDLNGLSKQSFFERLSEKFRVTPFTVGNVKDRAFRPQKAHHFGCYIEGEWFELVANTDIIPEADPVGSLDVSILQTHLLSPVLGIQDPRSDDRIHFVGGIRGLSELERLVDSGQYKVAFSLFPTAIDEIMAVADADMIMPPKSTWFEPKLRSGLIIHLLEELQ
jgi:uncharacterized protein (DUF1015 family)